MTSPLALIYYESLLIGNQLMNRLNDLEYRVVTVNDVARVRDQVAADKPIVFVAELGALSERVCAAVRGLRADGATEHVPVIGVLKAANRKAERKMAEEAQAAGFTLVASEKGFLQQLPALLEQALHVE